MTSRLLWCAAIVFAVATVPALTQSQIPAAPTSTASPPDAAFLKQYCVSCHNPRVKSGGLALDRLAARQLDPGAPALHRLNRAEYANVIRDLLALDVDVSALLPPDDSAAGFDNIADVLTVSPALIEGYIAAAAKISRSTGRTRASSTMLWPSDRSR